ncbi:hypothetical protein [Chryseobacterium sp. MP_3.2]|uniref:hypothetical protein n=1 Tax=Chryseobacterium sp. MP_3.2 TaxID=3071712 RepID=UPI002E064E13|nr:hypothetical protein [Chryseobacterium sp. MP_3.2]
MKIVKITFENGSEKEFKELPLEKFVKEISFRPEYHFKRQHKEWEEDILLPNLMTDIEDWAKDQYDLIEKSELKNIEDFSDGELLFECCSRDLVLNEMHRESIVNANFIQRIIDISYRGNDLEIDNALEILEKKYRIK